MENGNEQNVKQLRRTKSVACAEEMQKQETLQRRAQPDKPEVAMDLERTKVVMSVEKFKRFGNFTGFVNWAFLLLFMGGTRLFLENLIKYGIRVDPEQWLIVLTGRKEGGPEHPSLILLCYAIVPALLCLYIEKGMAFHIISQQIGMIAHVINITILVLIPMVLIHSYSSLFSLIGASAVCFEYSILFLKLWSYAHTNAWCRNDSKSGTFSKSHVRRQSLFFNNSDLANLSNGVPKSKIVVYPNNLNLKDLFYFLFAPTLCYELNFPRTDRIRKRFLVKRLLEVFIGLQVLASLFQQWIIPSVKNSLIPFSTMEPAKATERLLKLSIPNHLVWLIFFYLIFHSALNLVGEVMHFADRNFYLDWWNANNIDTFWRSWNAPVHKWAVRHLYLPLIEKGYGRNTATFLVFSLSAFFHEYLVSVPLRTYKVWAFTGMMAQIPLSIVCHYVEKRFGQRWGNIIVWASLILGQPLCIMMYYHDYVITHFGHTLLDKFGHA